MGSLSDTLLAGGAIPLLEVVHGETITVLTGPDAGKKFTAINEIEPDTNLVGEIATDARGTRYLHFNAASPYPRLGKLDKVQTSDGRKWKATLEPNSSYLTVDYKIVQTI